MKKEKVLFIEARSRLGLINPPFGETDANRGVELGPVSVLSDQFLQEFPSYEKIIFQFQSPEKSNKQKYFDVLTQDYLQFFHQINADYDSSKTLITVGGDHSVAFGSLAVVLKVHNPTTTGLVMIDSHTDLHQPSTSHSGNFHGMWLRPVIDSFEVQSINELIPDKVPLMNLMFLGNLNIETEEQEYILNNKIQCFSRQHITTSSFLRQFESFVQSMEHIHVSIDIDAFSHTFAPATGMMITNGLHPEDIFPILEILSKHKSLSIDLVEVNPTRKGSKQTIQLAQRLINTVTNFATL